MRPADVEQYVEMLAQYIDDPERRAEFVTDAKACIRL
jgi:hypothetical protein